MNVSIDQTSVELITVTNVIGEVLIYKEGTNSLDVSQLSTGVYEVIIQIDGRKIIKRFIKE
jgi:hypothetical protein